jgi:DNA-binding IclR family transcriptional regulator
MTDAASDPTPAPSRAKAPDPAAAVLDALRRATRPTSPEEIAASTGLSEPTVRRTLGRLVSTREARRAGGDRFTAARQR